MTFRERLHRDIPEGDPKKMAAIMLVGYRAGVGIPVNINDPITRMELDRLSTLSDEDFEAEFQKYMRATDAKRN